MMAAQQAGWVRRSQARDRVWAELAVDDRFRSAQDVHAALQSAGSRISLSTVYRNLQGMAEAGTADVVQTPAGETLYRYCGEVELHHHHLVCRVCGRTTEVASPVVERWAARVAATRHFTDVDHTVELVGVCGDCARDADRAIKDNAAAADSSPKTRRASR